MNITKHSVLIAICTVFTMAILLANRPTGARWVRVTETVVTPALPEPDKDVLSIITAEIQGPQSPRLAHVERLAGPGLTERLAPYRQAIEDVLPLMASLRARGDTLRYAQVANSVIAVWEEMRSICLEAVQDQSNTQELEGWYSEPVSLARH
jgi:hypothetical protein